MMPGQQARSNILAAPPIAQPNAIELTAIESSITLR
jgi:hypothetical protein